VVLGSRVAAVSGWCMRRGGIRQDKTRATVVAFTRFHRGSGSSGGGARRGATQRQQKQSREYINTQLITLSL